MVVDINEAAFTQLPPWFVALAASVATLIFFRRLCKRITPVEGNTSDILVDIASLLSAASVVASIGATRLVSSFTNSVERKINPSGDIVSVGGGIQVTAFVVFMAVLVFLGYIYTKTESGMTLAWFAIGVQVASIATPAINTVLGWWINNPIRWLWNGLMWLLDLLPGLEVTF